MRFFRNLFLISMILLFGGSEELQANLVFYKDEEGKIHATDNLDSIPAQYRSKVKALNAMPDSSRLILSLTRENNALLVPVRFGGNWTETLILDTGASKTMISRKVADRLQLKSKGVVSLNSASGAFRGQSATVEEIGIQGFTLKNFEVIIFDIPGSTHEGLLGLDFFNHFKMSLDSGAGTLQLDRK